MIWFIVAVVCAFLISKAAEHLHLALCAQDKKREERRMAEDDYRRQSLDELRAIGSLISGPDKPSLSERIVEARREIGRRQRVKEALDKELGIK